MHISCCCDQLYKSVCSCVNLMYLAMYSEGYKHFTAVKLDSTVKQDTVVMGTLINFGLEELTVYLALFCTQKDVNVLLMLS